jgi:hypothetical protein
MWASKVPDKEILSGYMINIYYLKLYNHNHFYFFAIEYITFSLKLPRVIVNKCHTLYIITLCITHFNTTKTVMGRSQPERYT